MRDSRALDIIAGVITLGAGAVIFFTRPGMFSPGLNSQPHQAAGVVLAKQALHLLEPGGQVTLIVRDTAAFPNPASDVLLASFQKTLHQGHAAIASIVTLQVDPLRPVEVPAGDFYELIKKTPKGSVIVSFMGPPLLSPEQRSRLGEVKPAIVAFCSGNLPRRLDLKDIFVQGLLHAAVVSRRYPTGTSPPRDQQGWFDRSFVAITPVDLAALAAVTETP
jgi:hypothetical protein